MFEFSVVSEIEPVKCDSEIMRIIKSVTEDLSAKAYQLPSGAAHDTQMLASITRAGMVFVPSKAGRSHSAAEWTDMDDIILGANVMLNTIYTLAEGQQ
jgi:N-carbamoyl-L-amino-acid hydrolase